MKKLLFYLFLTLHGFSQNLVQNPSFEEYDSCPNTSFATNLYDYVPYWNSLYFGSIYCNRCSQDNFGVPRNIAVNSYQETHSGDAYAGVDLLNNYSVQIREYIQNELSQPLQSGACYYVELYTSLLNNVMYATNNLGLYFTSTANIPLKTGYNYLLDGSPQVYPFGNAIISDTMNWVKVAGIYEAQGGEQYLTIGNFKTDEETDTVIFDPNAYDAAFYYIDDVSVIPINPSAMLANAGVDKQVIVGDSVFIGQEISNLNCTWRTLDGTVIGTNTSGLYVKPTQTTSYVVEQNLCGVVTYDTVKVSVGYVGLKSEKESENVVKIYPNPSNGEFYISISENNFQNQLLEILDMSGKLIYSDNIQFENGSLKLIRNLENGIYVFKLTDEQTKGQVLKKVTISNSK